MRGNDAAMVTGQQSAAFWREADAARRDVVRAFVEDAGHTVDDAPRALLIAAESAAKAMLVCGSAFDRMVEGGGPLSSDGRARRALAVYLQAQDRLERWLKLIGLERKAKPVDPMQALRDAVADANRDFVDLPAPTPEEQQ